MSDEALAAWIAAYRRETSSQPRDAGAIKRRVLVALGARQRRQLKVLLFAFPVAAVFFGSVALAAGKGTLPRLEDLREWLGVGTTEESSRTPERSAAGRGRSSLPASPQPLAPLVAQPVAPPASSPDTDARSASLIAVETAPPGNPSVPNKRLSPPISRPDPLRAELHAYRTAHRLHFDGGDPARTLAAWDAYLQAHRAGTFVAEARFNRALCLLRLGRRSEARSVLVPIAESPSAYGRRRARALLDAMGE
jgi:hypothetical protein